jgi:hypothetical protein
MEDKLNKTIQVNDYAMLMDTHWKSNDVKLLFIQVTRLTESRVYYRRLYITRPATNLEIHISETWTGSRKLMIINKEQFIEGVIQNDLKDLMNFFDYYEIRHEVQRIQEIENEALEIHRH